MADHGGAPQAGDGRLDEQAMDGLGTRGQDLVDVRPAPQPAQLTGAHEAAEFPVGAAHGDRIAAEQQFGLWIGVGHTAEVAGPFGSRVGRSETRGQAGELWTVDFGGVAHASGVVQDSRGVHTTQKATLNAAPGGQTGECCASAVGSAPAGRSGFCEAGRVRGVLA